VTAVNLQAAALHFAGYGHAIGSNQRLLRRLSDGAGAARIERSAGVV
jgi:hypothetical protein